MQWFVLIHWNYFGWWPEISDHLTSWCLQNNGNCAIMECLIALQWLVINLVVDCQREATVQFDSERNIFIAYPMLLIFSRRCLISPSFKYCFMIERVAPNLSLMEKWLISILIDCRCDRLNVCEYLIMWLSEKLSNRVGIKFLENNWLLLCKDCQIKDFQERI